MTMTRTPTTGTIRRTEMLNFKNNSDIDWAIDCIKRGATDLVAYLNGGGFKKEGVFSAQGSKFDLFNTFDDFGDSTEISKRLSPVLEKGLAYCATVYLSEYDIVLRQEDGDGYDYVLEHSDGTLIDYIELKITRRKEKDRLDLWTLNKNSLVKVPLHLLIGYKTMGDKISEMGVFLTDARSAAVTRFVPPGDNHSFAQLRLLPAAMNCSKFVKLIGDLSMMSVTGRNTMYKRPYVLMESMV